VIRVGTATLLLVSVRRVTEITYWDGYRNQRLSRSEVLRFCRELGIRIVGEERVPGTVSAVVEVIRAEDAGRITGAARLQNDLRRAAWKAEWEADRARMASTAEVRAELGIDTDDDWSKICAIAGVEATNTSWDYTDRERIKRVAIDYKVYGDGMDSTNPLSGRGEPRFGTAPGRTRVCSCGAVVFGAPCH
jgi:hypothetical protein